MSESRIRVKMCGMTREEDIAHAASLGVDAIGVIFYHGSRRCVSLQRAKILLREVPLFVDVVAVMVNPTREEVVQITQELPVNWLQFHGDETPEFCRQFKNPYIKSITASSTQAILDAMGHYESASAILLDTPSDSQRGGSGIPFDWSRIPSKRSKPIILAGGLTAGNVREAIQKVRPYAVDVCSGIEQSPGMKDHHKMTQFINALRDEKNE